MEVRVVNIPRIEPAVSLEPDGLTRRTMVGAGATGLALALLARNVSRTRAQDSTPAAEGGMPEGVGIKPIIDIPVRLEDVPSGPFKISLYDLTLEPGAVIPQSSFPYPNSVYVESGTLVCPGRGPRYLIHADGSVEEFADEGDITINTGEAIYHPPDVIDGAENRGTDQVVLLAVDLVPIEEMATPSA
jgi:quercetin dioxygenase-like cupin family protein